VPQHDDGTWRRMRLKLILRRVLDPGLVVFGADEHRYRLRPPVSIEQLRDFEKLHGITLPSDYRQFLLQAGNGGAGPYYGILPLEESPVYGDLASRSHSLKSGKCRNAWSRKTKCPLPIVMDASPSRSTAAAIGLSW
jgi:hypothetical protein